MYSSKVITGHAIPFVCAFFERNVILNSYSTFLTSFISEIVASYSGFLDCCTMQSSR